MHTSTPAFAGTWIAANAATSFIIDYFISCNSVDVPNSELDKLACVE